MEKLMGPIGERLQQSHNIFLVLVKHFFRRFFDNDTVQVEGDTLITVVRAACAVAVPGLMYAFFLQNAYNVYPYRAGWDVVEDEYFFVLFSFVVMGAVSIFEWEMLFPDRQDFLILTPMPLKALHLLAAKASALVAFFTIFLVSASVFGAGILPLLSKGFPFHQMYAHGVAVLLAGSFAALSSLALGGLLLCVLGAARFRLVSPIVQMLSVTALVLLLIAYWRYGTSLPALLADPHAWGRWVPPFWFLGLYQHLQYGDHAPAFARPFARYALGATAMALALVVLTYPLAWSRMRRLAIEGTSQPRRQPSRWSAALLHGIIRRPGERAVFHFIGQTIVRNNRYQVYLSMYAGTGLALTLACAFTFQQDAARFLPMLSIKGMHAVMPLLLFWLIAGMRTAFNFPLSLSAGWIFRITGVPIRECADAARKWVLAGAAASTLCILAALAMAGWNADRLLVQAVCGLCLSILLTDGIFFFSETVPFNQPRMPGKTSLPILLTAYIGVFPLFVAGVVWTEIRLETHLPKLLLLAAGTVFLHAGLGRLRHGSDDIAEEVEGYEGEFQVLGLG